LGAFSPQAPDERTRARPRTQTRASREFVKGKTLKSLGTKKQEAFLKPQRGFRLKFFERFGKLFPKKVFQGFALALKMYPGVQYPGAHKPGVRKRRPRNGGLVDGILYIHDPPAQTALYRGASNKFFILYHSRLNIKYPK
jgi:hypothetical protein